MLPRSNSSLGLSLRYSEANFLVPSILAPHEDAKKANVCRERWAAMSVMTSHRILITAEYLNAHFFSVFLFVYALHMLKALFYADFRKLGWKLNCLVYCAPPCVFWRTVIQSYLPDSVLVSLLAIKLCKDHQGLKFCISRPPGQYSFTKLSAQPALQASLPMQTSEEHSQNGGLPDLWIPEWHITGVRVITVRYSGICISVYGFLQKI